MLNLLKLRYISTLLCIAVGALLVMFLSKGWSQNGGGGELRRSAGALTESLDPHQVIANNDGVVVSDLFEGLVAYRPGEGLIPGVALSWTISKDGMTYTFFLRPDAKWSNGDAVTARDFVFAWQRLIDPKTAAPYASYLDAVKNASEITAGKREPNELGVREITPTVLEVQLKQPTPFFLHQLRHYATFPLHEKSLNISGIHWTRPGNLVSNGAYVLKSWTPGSDILLTVNPFFHSSKKGGYQKVRYIPNDDSATELLMWKSDALDVTTELQPNMLAKMKQEFPTAVRVDPLLGTFFLALNLEHPALADVRVRQALAMSIDRDALVRVITKSGEIAAERWIPPTLPGVQPIHTAWTTLPMHERLQLARDLMKQAGFSDDHVLELNFVYDMGSIHREIAIACADMWSSIGVHTNLLNVEKRVLSTLRTDRQFDVLRAGWTGDYADAHTFLEIWLSGAGGLNQSRYKSAKYDSLVSASRKESDPVLRAGLVQEAERTLLNDMPMIPLYFFARRGLVKDEVCGWVHDPVLDSSSRWLWPKTSQHTC